MFLMNILVYYIGAGNTYVPIGVLLTLMYVLITIMCLMEKGADNIYVPNGHFNAGNRGW